MSRLTAATGPRCVLFSIAKLVFISSMFIWFQNVEGCQKHRELTRDRIIFYYFLRFMFDICFAALCNEDANGNVALGKSCNRYWNCQGGYPRLQRCPAMLVFDKHSARCVVPPTEDCDIIATPAPIEDQPQAPAERGQVSLCYKNFFFLFYL